MKKPEDIRFATDDVKVYLAAAGAGKTTAIMDEMTGLLDTYRPDEIAFVTFTRKGVINGIERALRANRQLSADDLVYFRTLHALCFRELGLKHASIIEAGDLRQFNKLLGFRLTMDGPFDKQTKGDKLLSRYDALRSGSRKGVLIHETYDEERYQRLIRAYESFKEINNLVDFHDCLLKFRDAGKPVNVKVAFIDEAQDLTMLQWEVCQTAFSRCEKIRIAGDDFQSLFTYAGASPKTLIELAARYQTVKLETSYRLPNAVYRFAKGITENIGNKIDKDFKPSKDFEGFVEAISDRHLLMRRIRKDIADNGFTPYRWYLLFRNNCFIGSVKELLEQYAIPYHIAQDFCIPKAELAKIKRYYNFRKKGFGSKEAFEHFCARYEIKDINEDFTESKLIKTNRRYLYADYVEKYGIAKLEELSRSEPSILLSTTHRVKGGEADYVAVFLDCTRRVSNNVMVNVDEELRVFYVACTRAKLGLYLAASDSGHGLDKMVEVVREMAA